MTRIKIKTVVNIKQRTMHANHHGQRRAGHLLLYKITDLHQYLFYFFAIKWFEERLMNRVQYVRAPKKTTDYGMLGQ